MYILIFLESPYFAVWDTFSADIYFIYFTDIIFSIDCLQFYSCLEITLI